MSQTGQEYVCNGALCRCDKGSLPSQLRVLSNQTVHVQGKLMATTLDKLFVPFGTCLVKNNTPCVPALLMWQDYFDKVSLMTPAQHPLLEKSTIMCALGGKVSIVSTLQIKVPGVPTPAQAEGLRTAGMSLAPLLMGANPEEIGGDAEAGTTAPQLAASLSPVGSAAEIARIEQAICDPHAVQHIFEDEIKPVTRGQVRVGSTRTAVAVGGSYGTGVHSMEAVNTGKARIAPTGRVAPNGAFEAEVELLDQSGNVVPKKAPGKSTFFPPAWSKKKTMQEIEHAYNGRVFDEGNAWVGAASDGSKIKMFLDANGKIISAFPSF